MFIPRDMTAQLEQVSARIQILIGPRQCGKSTLLASLSKNLGFQEISFDDLRLRQLANSDPALLLQQFDSPLLLDEVQYVPNLFPELKKKIDQLKREEAFSSITNKTHEKKILYRLTGSNQILMDKNVKESLAGRASYYYLSTLTVHEIINALPHTSIKEILFKGGWPELYTDTNLSAIAYLNDYLRSYVEKDIILSAGIQKVNEFHVILGLFAARTAQLVNFESMAKDGGISSVTVKEWMGLLERMDLIYVLRPYFSNLNKRLLKTPKLYFLDTGLAVRLQGWQDMLPMMMSPQAGHLFETLVLAELVKFIRNYRKDWQLFFWRTKEGEEVDFVLQTDKNTVHAFEVKLAIQGIPESVSYPSAFKQHFSPKKPLVIICFGETSAHKGDTYQVVPIARLHDYLQTLS